MTIRDRQHVNEVASKICDVSLNLVIHCEILMMALPLNLEWLLDAGISIGSFQCIICSRGFDFMTQCFSW